MVLLISLLKSTSSPPLRASGNLFAFLEHFSPFAEHSSLPGGHVQEDLGHLQVYCLLTFPFLHSSQTWTVCRSVLPKCVQGMVIFVLSLIPSQAPTSLHEPGRIGCSSRSHWNFQILLDLRIWFIFLPNSLEDFLPLS